MTKRLVVGLLGSITACGHAPPCELRASTPPPGPCGAHGIEVRYFGEVALSQRARQHWLRLEGTHQAIANLACAESPALPCATRPSAPIELELQLGTEPICEISTCAGDAGVQTPISRSECARVLSIPVQVSARIRDTPFEVFADHQRLFVFADGHIELSAQVRNPWSVREWLGVPHEMALEAHVLLEPADHGTRASLSLQTERVDAMVGIEGWMSADWTFLPR